MAEKKPIVALMLLSGVAPVLAQGLNILHPQGVYTEPATGMIFPIAVGDFQRVSIIKYKPDGSDESGGYNRVVPNAEIGGTVYIFPSPGMTGMGPPQTLSEDARASLCEAQFHGVEREVTTAHPDAERQSEEKVSLEQAGTTYHGFRASYTLVNARFFGRTQVPSRSDAYVFCFANAKWTVEYRFDYPAGYDAGDAIAEFMRDLKWRLGTHI